jgi:hypothetical protein
MCRSSQAFSVADHRTGGCAGIPFAETTTYEPRRDPMATRSASLPIERTYLSRAWLILAAILLVAVAVVTIVLGAARSAPAGGTFLGPVPDFGPVTTQNEPIVVNGSVCGQCR